MLELPNVTLCCVSSVRHDQSLSAIKRTISQCKFPRVVYMTDDQNIQDPEIEKIIIPRLNNVMDYSRFMVHDINLHLNLDTSHVLIIQWDGFVTNPNAWTDEFLEYDYIGSRWYRYPEGRDVGNGGFSLRSKKLLLALQNFNNNYAPEDDFICQHSREILENTYQIKYAPNHIAEKFGHEPSGPEHNPFGFHGAWHFKHYGIT